jgi:hypothetical protein
MATKYYCDLCDDEVKAYLFERDKTVFYEGQYFNVRVSIQSSRDNQGRGAGFAALCETHAGDLLSLLTS